MSDVLVSDPIDRSESKLTMEWKREGISQSLLSLGGKDQLSLPSMPDVMQSIQNEMHSRYPRASRIIDIISSNTVITGEILNIVKSPFYLRHVTGAIEIKSISHVVNLVGLKKTYELAMAASMKSLPHKTDLFKKIIDHSASLAAASSEIAAFVHDVEIEDAYLYGLFKESGALALASHLNESYEKAWLRNLSFPQTGVSLETRELRARHDYLGVAVVRNWGFGKDKAELEMLFAIQEHHNYEEIDNIPNQRVKLLMAIGMLADIIVCENNTKVYLSEEIVEVKKKVMSVLGISRKILDLISANYRKIAVEF
jgi:HD-like signal output (HDOD) protein